jgi:hypothetical protein
VLGHQGRNKNVPGTQLSTTSWRRRGCGVIAPRILNLGAVRRWLVSFTATEKLPVPIRWASEPVLYAVRTYESVPLLGIETVTYSLHWLNYLCPVRSLNPRACLHRWIQREIGVLIVPRTSCLLFWTDRHLSAVVRTVEVLTGCPCVNDRFLNFVTVPGITVYALPHQQSVNFVLHFAFVHSITRSDNRIRLQCCVWGAHRLRGKITERVFLHNWAHVHSVLTLTNCTVTNENSSLKHRSKVL